jgi:hypothetical protein
MEHCSITLYLTLKGLSAMKIHSNPTKITVTQAVAYSTMTGYLHITSFTDPIEVKENQDRPSSSSEIDEAILNALADELFSSLYELTRHTYLSKTITHPHLTGSLDFTIWHFR